MPWTPDTWSDLPDKSTPISAARLDHLGEQYAEAVADATAAAATYTDDELAAALLALTKSSVGLGNVDNTSDANALSVAHGKNATKYKFVAAVLRRVSSTEWAWLDDSGHTPTGVSAIAITSTYIRLTYDFTATKVGTLIVTPDEAFAAVAGFRVGASVGTSYSDIYCYIGTNTTPSDPGLLSTAGANLWVYGLFEVA